MYKVNESQMAKSHVDTVVDDAPLKLDVLRTHDPVKVNAVLSEFGNIMKRESDIYRELQVSLSYDYILEDGEKVNVINFSCVKDGKLILFIR